MPIVQLEDENGRPVGVNPDFVIAVIRPEPEIDGDAVNTVVLSNGGNLLIHGIIEDIVACLNGGRGDALDGAP